MKYKHIPIFLRNSTHLCPERFLKQRIKKEKLLLNVKIKYRIRSQFFVSKGATQCSSTIRILRFRFSLTFFKKKIFCTCVCIFCTYWKYYSIVVAAGIVPDFIFRHTGNKESVSNLNKKLISTVLCLLFTQSKKEIF